MPEPLGRGQRYMPGLDGLRALAVIGVVVFHLGFGFLPGGLLGVSVFFTLSGYLITDLLMSEWRSSGQLQLGDFWIRRARRLLPALFVMLAVVSIWVSVGDPSQLGALRGDVFSSAVYANNWWLIFHHVSYFERFGPPSPLGNLWSLAVEEQFYLLWPWLLLGGLLWARRGGGEGRARLQRMARRRDVLVGTTLVVAVASAVEMAVLYHPGLDPTRLYDGTDTRAFGLLFGAALAMVWPSRQVTGHVSDNARRLLDTLGVVGLVGIALLMWRTTQYSAFLYRGGLVLLSLATVLVIVAASHPATWVGKALGWGPLRWIGLWSYAIYLWHYPIIVLTTPTLTHGVDKMRVLLQVGAIVGIAALSWKFIETPVRHGALGRWWKQLRSTRGRVVTDSGPARPAVIAALAGLVVTVVALAGVIPAAPANTLTTAVAPKQSLSRVVSGIRHVHVPTTTTTTTVAGGAGSTTTAPPAPMSSCTSVVHLGDSTSESLVDDTYISPPEQLPAQYGRVGASTVNLQISGARSTGPEEVDGQPNGDQVAQQLVSQGYHGCWVLALGTNDAADIAVGSNTDAQARIQKIMSIIGNQPVMWVNVVSLLTSGYYANANMQAWNAALVAACPAYPSMRIYDWASVAQPGWFISDGIHYSSAGSVQRSADFANALATAFPATPVPTHKGSPPPSCVIQ
ncbi:MAG TPA: acyltransferase family protein [Acidimicrobiales bacterium]|nr:acyltransferase family protein [Acidimicrobiales bacterium]